MTRTPKHDQYIGLRVERPLPFQEIPEPIFDENPQYVDLYAKAWQLSWNHVLERCDSPQRFYLDEAMTPDRIWIWDTCFMALYCRYAPKIFPGIESLNNFYYIIHDRQKAPYRIHHPDNPPLFAWIEWEYFKMTGDLARLKWVLQQNQYLQKHYRFIEEAKSKKFYPYAGVWLFANKTPHGFLWSGIASGMDNTPRGRGKYGKMLWLDLAAQQALAAENIIKIAQVLNLPELIQEYQQHYDQYRALLNKYYWNSEDGIYYDIEKRHPDKQIKVKTPAAFWPMLAGLTSQQQAEGLVQNLLNDQILGGELPFPSVARNDKDFDVRGQYWRGGVWLPTSYMGIKALERYGFRQLADEFAEKTLNWMVQTYQNYFPATIWECYSPEKLEPATGKRNAYIVRPDFCGWSALGPISLFIENIIGFYEINAYERKICWNIHHKGRHGIKNIQFGDIKCDMVYEDGQIQCQSNNEFSLYVNEQEIKVKAGAQTVDLKGTN